MENISRYIIRASFSQERMKYLSEASKVIYKSRNGKDTKEFEALDFIASITSHIPNRNEQTVRYLGYYSNVSRGKRKKQGSLLRHLKKYLKAYSLRHLKMYSKYIYLRIYS
jgi:hypothetical protein